MGNPNKHQSVAPQFYRLPQLKIRLGISGSSIWAWVKKGAFPAPIKLSENTTAWLLSDIEAWEQARINASQNKGS
jgi:prophage regulatory protein